MCCHCQEADLSAGRLQLGGGLRGDGGIGGMPTHFATDDDDGKHGARLGPPGSAHFVGDYTYILTTKIDWRRKRFAPVLFAADFRFVRS